MANIGTARVRIAPDMTGIQGKVARGFKGSGTQVANQMGGEISGRSAAIIGAIAGIASAAASRAMNMISQSIGGAVRRVDTLNNAARTFEFMGFKAEDAEKATSELVESITGLPTPLDSAMRGMSALAATYGDVNQGQKVFSALNNAILGFGGTADQVDGAIQQLASLPMDGPLSAQVWNSLQKNGLTPLLVAMAKESGKSVSEFKKALGDGEITVGDFNKMLLKMNKEGGGGLASLEEIARSATSGIGTSWANMQTAITRGVANIIQAIGQENIAKVITNIGNGFERVLKLISDNIPQAIKAIQNFVDFIVRNKDIFAPIAVGIGAIVAAITAWKTALLILNTVTKAARAVQAAFNVVMGLNPVAVIALAVIGLTAALVYFFTQTETGRRIFANFTTYMQDVWQKLKDGVQSVGDFFARVWGDIKKAIDVVTSTARRAIKWLYDWRQWFINIGIVLSTFLIPTLIKIGITAAKSAAQSIAAFAKMSATAVASAVKTGVAWSVQAARATLAWIKAFPSMIAGFVKTAAAATVNAIKAGIVWVQQAVLVAQRWAITFALYLKQIAIAAAQTLIAGAKMAAAWLLAAGPIGLLVAVVAAAVALIIANWDTVKKWLSSFWNWLRNTGSAAWNRIRTAVSAVFDWIKRNWPLILAILTGPIGIAVSLIIRHWATIRGAFQSAFNFVTGLWSRIGNFFRNIFNNIKNAFSGIPNVGKDIVRGLWNGISGMGGWIKDKLVGFVKNNIPGPVKKALGISSPSKLFASFGRDINRGLAQGIEKNARMVNKAVDTMTNEAISGMADTNISPNIAANLATTNGAMPGQAGGGPSTQTTTIQNVYLGDASAVREFFKQLNQDTINVGLGMTPIQGARG